MSVCDVIVGTLIGSPPSPFSPPGYAVGLIVTFVVLVLMKTAQPTLLYLVPFTLIPTLVSALAHRELKLLLFGPPVSCHR